MKYFRSRGRGALRAELLAASFAAASRIYIDLVGRLMLAEILATASLIMNKPVRLIRAIPRFKSIVLGYAIFLAGLVISDIYNGTSSHDYLRGWAAIIFGVISTIFLTAQFMKSRRAILIYLTAAAATAVFLSDGGLDMMTLEENSNYFKVKFVPILLPTLALASCLIWKKSRLLAAGLLFVGGIIFMVFDARSSGFALILASLLLMVQIFRIRPKLPQILFSSLLISAIAYAGYVYYVNQVLYHGMGGANAQQVLEAKNPYNPFELLLIGRASVVVAGTAIADRPVLGFGSWARDETGEYGLLYGSLKGMDYFVHKLGIIPAHSMALAAWVWAGFAGFVGMAIVGMAMWRLYIIAFWNQSILTPAVNIYFISSFWAFFFSPLGSIRTSFPFAIALLLVAAYDARLKKIGNEHSLR